MSACFGRAALMVAAMTTIGFGATSARAQDAPPSFSETAPSVEALRSSWPRRTFERRSSGLMVTAIVFASAAFTAIGAGGVVYGEAKDSCLDRHQSNGRASGHFCFANRTQFDVGMGMMVTGGAVFALTVPVAVWAGSGTPRQVSPSASIRLGPASAAIAGTF